MNTIPSAIDILNLYLYGQQNTPSPQDLGSDTFIRGENELKPIMIDTKEYMTSGAGRFASPEQFKIVKDFLEGDGDFGLKQGESIVLTKKQVAKVYNIDYYGLVLSQYFLGYNDNDYADRAYVFGTTAFSLSEDTQFIINSDGSREIRNLSIEPVFDNFDFSGGNIVADASNFITEDYIDPSKIGRKVTISFIGDTPCNYEKITKETLKQLIDKNKEFQSAYDATVDKINVIKKELFGLGVDVLLDDMTLKQTVEALTKLAESTGIPVSSVINYLILHNSLSSSDALRYKDEDGRFVYFGTSNDDSITAADAFSLIGNASDLRSYDDYKGITIIAGKGNDQLEGGYKTDHLVAGDGDDTLSGGTGNDYLDGGTGNDTYQLVSGSHCTIVDCDGKGVLQVDGKAMSGVFSRDNAYLNFYYSADKNYRIYQNDDGTSELAVKTANSYVNIAKLEGWSDGDFGITLKTNLSNSTQNTLQIGNKSLYLAIDASASSTDTLIYGGDTADSVRGSGHKDEIHTGDGNSFVLSWGGDDQIYGGKDNDFVISGGNAYPGDISDNDIVMGGGGSDILFSGGGDDFLYGNTNDLSFLNETADSTKTGDWLSGGKGNDYIKGSDAQDALLGGSENDMVYGGAGNDLILGDSSYMPTGNYGSIYGPTVFSCIANYKDGQNTWTYKTNDPENTLTVVSGNAFKWQWGVDAAKNITLTSESPLTNFTTFLANRVDINAGDDILDGGKGNDWIAGQAGNDTLFGGDGDDILYGDDAQTLNWGVEGNDKIYTDAGSDYAYGGGGNDIINATDVDNAKDWLYGGAGDDILIGGTGKDQLQGDAGNDDLYAGTDGSTLLGGEGNDYLVGDIGNDDMQGGTGSDFYASSSGTDVWTDESGSDVYQLNSIDFTSAAKTTIIDTDGLGAILIDGINLTGQEVKATSKTTWKANSGAYTLELKAGSLFISMKDAAGSVEIKNFVNSKDGYLGLVLPEYMNHAPVLAAPLPDKAAKEDKAFKFVLPAGTFTDSDAGDSLSLSASLSNGKALPAWLKFNAKTRTFSGTPDNDQVGAIAIRVTATDKAGAKASDVFKVTVQNTNDTPEVVAALPEQKEAKEGALFKYVAPLNEVFKDVDKGDVLTYSSTLADGSPLPAWLRFDAATGTFSGTPVTGSAGLLGLMVTATDKEGASVSNGFSLNIGGTINVLKGTSDNDTLKGSEGQDKIYGYDGDDTLYGRGGDDALSGSNGNDRLDGGAGNDDLFGGAGNDTYFFGKGYGQDLISDTDATFYNLDRLLFKSGIATDQLWFKNSNNNLEVSIIGTSDTVTIKNWFTNSNAHIEQLKTADGKTLLDTQVANLVNAMATLTPPAAGETSLSTAYHNKLDVVIAANWK